MARVGEDLTYGYWPILKTEKVPDGLMVYGKAAGPGLDLDGQRFSAEYLKTAVPEWFKWANVREQHSPQIAAGVGHELEDRGNGEFWVKALVVDPVTIKKIETKVLKGFSPGIKNGRVTKSASAPNGLIVAGDMIELSLVDRPSDPTNSVMICKSAGGALFLPTDANGQELAYEGGSPVMWLTQDLYKSATATAHAVLEGEYEQADQPSAETAVRELADLLIAEGFMLKSAKLSDGQYDVSGLRNAAEAILALAEPEEDYPGMNADFADLRKSATIGSDTTELVKAVTADLTKAFNAKLEAVMAEVATLKATPVGNGAPMVLPPQRHTQPSKPAGTGIDFLAKAASTDDPGLRAVYADLAKMEGGATS